MNENNKILDEHLIDTNNAKYENASVVKRFCIGFIDVIIIFLFYSVIIACLVKLFPSFSYEAAVGVLFISIVIYYFIFEFMFKGRTIGKFITKTKVVNKKGKSPTIKQVLTRIFCRFMPFEYFTILTRKDRTTLHDGASGTRVVKIK